MPAVRYYATDLLTGRLLMELPLSGVGFDVRVNDAGELKASVALSAAAGIADNTTPGRTALYADLDRTILWGGILWGRRYASGSNRLDLDGKGFLSYLDRIDITTTLTYAGVDQIDIAKALINYAMTKGQSNLGFVFTGTAASGVLRDRTYLAADTKTVGAALRELSAVEHGFDFIGACRWVGNTVERSIQFGFPKLGRSLADSRLVVDAHADLTGWNFAEDAWTAASTVYATGAVPAGAVEGTLPPTCVADYAPIRNGGFPRLEATTAYTDIITMAALIAHANGDLALSRSNLITMALTMDEFGGAGPGLTELVPGDEMLFRVGAGDEFYPLGALVRGIIVSVAITLDDQQNPSVALDIAPTEIITNPAPNVVLA